MKFLSLLFLTSSAIASHLRGNNEPAAFHRILQEDLVGTYLKSATQHAEKRMSEEDNIELVDGSGTIYSITNPGKSGWAKEQGLKSGVSTVVVGKGATISGSKIDVKGNPPKGVPDSLFHRNLMKDEVLTPEQEANLAKLQDQRRRLAVVNGTKPVLAVKVIHTGLGPGGGPSLGTTTNNATVIADSIFGAAVGGSDVVNMNSQFKACSHGKLNMIPAANQTSSNGAVTNIVNGVVEVTVNTNCTTLPCDGVMRNNVNSALSAAFGSAVLGGTTANHVMHCLPPNAMSGIAYAYVNSWNSVYSDIWCEYPSSNLHEIGHNLNLAHSGEGTNEYDDRTGFMGYSYASDEQKMCYNNAKNWQLNWFTGAYKTLTLNTDYVGPIKGQINYDVSGVTQTPIVVKVANFYIGFNHKAKHNINTNEAANQVTIQEYASTGYAISYLRAKLSAGGTWNTTIGADLLKVTVSSITTTADTGVAQVNIVYGVVPVPTTPPTKKPTSNPTTASPSKAPTNQPTPVPTTSPTKKPTSSPSQVPTNQPSSSSPTNAPTTSSPSNIPTKKPTGSPTKQPTDAPTLSPSNSPTVRPTLPGFCTDGSGRCSDTALGHLTTDLSSCACSSTRRLPPRTPKPTRAPTKKPTAAPTSAAPTRSPQTSPPTSEPTTLAPTSEPTSQPTIGCGCSLSAPSTSSV